MEEIKRIGRQLVHKGTIIECYRDIMETSDGKTLNFDFIGHRGAAAIIPVDENGNILMVRQYRPAIEKYTLEIPAGGLEPNEDMKTCAIRECEEETGYKAGSAEHLTDIFTTVAFCNEKIGIYYTNDLIPSKQNLDEDEYVDVERHSLDALVAMILDGTIQDSKTISGLLAYKAKIGL